MRGGEPVGLLSDFFIATQAEVDALDIARSPAGSLPTLQARSIEVVKLTQLQCIVDGSQFSDHLKELGSMIVRSADDDGPWVILVPDVVTRTLAQSEASELQRIAIAWASTDEWQRDRAKPKDIVSLIQGLGTLAKRAKVDNREMYLWACL